MVAIGIATATIVHNHIANSAFGELYLEIVHAIVHIALAPCRVPEGVLLAVEKVVERTFVGLGVWRGELAVLSDELVALSA